MGRISAPPATERKGALSSEDGQRLAALEREVHQLRAAKLKASVRSQHDAAGVSTLETLDGTDVREQPDPEQEKRLAREAQIAYWDELSARADAEPPDPTWRRETEPVITRVIQEQLGPQVRVGDVVCSSSLCRAKLTHPEWPHIPSDKFVQFTLNRGSLGAMEIQLDTRAEGATVLYFLRREHAPTKHDL